MLQRTTQSLDLEFHRIGLARLQRAVKKSRVPAMKHNRLGSVFGLTVFRSALVAAVLGSAALGSTLLCSKPAQAFPGIFAGPTKNGGADAPRYNHSTQVVVFKKDGVTAVTVMVDYQGPLDKFVWLLPVPSDVKLNEVRTLRRDIVDHVDQVSAPRFAEFWEMDPCEPGPAEQDWERNLKVEGGGFLGDPMLAEAAASKKVPKELLVVIDPEFRDSLYKMSMIPAGADVAAALKKQGYQLSEAAAKEAARYPTQQFLVVEVDAKQIEISGMDRAILSPIRFSTRENVNIAATVGRSNIKDKQELLLYVLDPTQRYEVANYPNVFPPTNVLLDFKAKERMGELYSGLHDVMLSKNPGSFLVEYAWTTKGCGQPCATSPLYLAELLGLGGDAVEANVPDKERNPEPPPMTDEEKEAYKKLKPKEKKELDAQRKEVARRKALIARNEAFVLTRLHYRYGAADLPKDIELRPAGNVEGGIDLPKGAKGEASIEVTPTDKPNRLQTRFNNLHVSPSEVKCEKRERNRWGKAPRTYRGLRKIWQAQDLATRNRTLFKLPEIIQTPLPKLGIKPVAAPGEATKANAAPAASAQLGNAEAPAEKKGGCTMTSHAPQGGTGGLAALGIALLLWVRRKKP